MPVTTKSLRVTTWFSAGCGLAVAFLFFVLYEPYWVGFKIFVEETLVYAAIAVGAAMVRSRFASALIFALSLPVLFLGAYADIDIAVNRPLYEGVMWVGPIRCALAPLALVAAIIDFLIWRSLNARTDNP